MFARIFFLFIIAASTTPLPVRAEVPPDVQSILEENCVKCHGQKKKSGKLDLRTLDAMLVGGKRGTSIVKANASASRLWQLVQPGAKPHMPPGKKNQLTEPQMSALAAWINQLPSDQIPSDQVSAEPRNEAPETHRTEQHSEPNSEPANSSPDLSPGSSASLPSASAKPRTVINLLVQDGYAKQNSEPNSICDDRTFVRRVHLDLIGRIPRTEELQQFLSQTESHKRRQLIDTLVESDEFAAYWSSLFDTMLMGRNEKKISDRKKHGWHEYLRNAFQDDRPWNDVAREVLLARGGDGDNRGHLWFLYERNNKHQEVAESIAKGFFGIDIACAQCHDHPLADEIEQQHYWGLVAFFSRSKNGKSDGKLVMEESAIGGFSSYANALTGSTDEAVLSFLGRETVPEIRPKDPAKQEDKDEFYVSVKAERVPRFSRREKFVEEVLQNHPLVARAMVNRVWALLMGRGIVHPIEEMDSKHPASHPELLDWLSRDFASHRYSVKRLVTEIVNSDAYQLDSRRPPSIEPRFFAFGLEKPLTAEAMLASFKVALQLDDEELDGGGIDAELRKLFPDIAPENTLTNLKQSLMLSNHPAIQEAMKKSADKMTRGIEPQHQVEELFLRVYGRRPQKEEAAAVLDYVGKRADRRSEAMSQVVWAMVTSAEFRFNH